MRSLRSGAFATPTLHNTAPPFGRRPRRSGSLVTYKPAPSALKEFLWASSGVLRCCLALKSGVALRAAPEGHRGPGEPQEQWLPKSACGASGVENAWSVVQSVFAGSSITKQGCPLAQLARPGVLETNTKAQQGTKRSESRGCMPTLWWPHAHDIARPARPNARESVWMRPLSSPPPGQSGLSARDRSRFADAVWGDRCMLGKCTVAARLNNPNPCARDEHAMVSCRQVLQNA